MPNGTSPFFRDPGAVWKAMHSANYSQRGMPNLAPVYMGNRPGFAGVPWLTSVLSDPYNIPQDWLRQRQAATEAGYNRAANELRARQYAAGARHSGVGRGQASQMALARGAQQAADQRQWNQYRQKMGDARIMGMLFPWLSAYNQNFATMRGALTSALQNQGGSRASDVLGTLQNLADFAALF